MRTTRLLLSAAVILATAACGGGGTATGGPAGFESRPYALEVAPGHDAAAPAALLVVLHGYGGTSTQMSQWWQLPALARARDVLIAIPDGTPDAGGLQFWNGTDICCDDGRGVDDVGYLRALIADVSARYAVDPARVYVTGHSNGGIMSHRMACDAADVVAAIAPVSGTGWRDRTRCVPTSPVPVLEIMGTQDPTWTGWRAGAATEPEDMATWSALDGCTGALTDTGDRLDLVTDVAGAETRVSRFACPAGAAVEEWAMVGVPHSFRPQPDWGGRILDWLEAHRRE